MPIITDSRGCPIKEDDEVLVELKSIHLMCKIHKIDEGGLAIPNLQDPKKSMITTGTIQCVAIINVSFLPGQPVNILKLAKVQILDTQHN
jgi:hypothetical protein